MTDPRTNDSPHPRPTVDPERDRIVAEEQGCLDRILTHLDTRRPGTSESPPGDYDRALLELRDEIAAARLEDVPPLIEQMERLQSLAARRRVGNGNTFVDRRSPYFGHLVLEEGARRREVFIGRSTYLDTDSGIRIVDWRDAPVSRLYYRYDEGDDYEETFGDRPVEGQVVTRRSVSIVEARLRRINSPQGAFARTSAGDWRRLDLDALKLQGGQGTAPRVETGRAGRLGIGHDEGREDRHLREITALIDPRQFELISQPESGLVVIQGGAGSGKTTIGLHRLAYLAYRDPQRFRADRMLVVVFNEALARYISLVLPALDVEGVAIRTYEDWASRVRSAQLPRVPRRYHDETPVEATRVKKHPAILHAIVEHVGARAKRVGAQLESVLASTEPSEAATRLLSQWRSGGNRPLAHRLHALAAAARDGSRSLPAPARVAVERIAAVELREAEDVVGAWAELLTDRAALEQAFAEHAPALLQSGDVARAHAWCVARCAEVVAEVDAGLELDPRSLAAATADDGALAQGVDGRDVEEQAALDREDDSLLLLLWQKLRGPLKRGAKGKEALVYEHVLIDEAQDLSPVDLAVVLGTVSRARSITLAGDVAQRLYMDNGFSDFETVLGELGLAHVAVEPLRLSYRSTLPIIQFAHDVLGPLAPEHPPEATRAGAPVELFGFGHSGDAVGFLAEALRDLMLSEPHASVAVIARFPEHADLYFDGLTKAEVPRVRRIAEQDFPFQPGIDVTDVRQVKGLEFDYVIVVEVSEAAYPPDDEARHLLHIAATRASHQLWVLTTSRPSPLLPRDLLDRGY